MMITIGHDAEVLRSTWFFQVLHMTLGKATVEEVLKLARDKEEECQTYYYYGERLLTERHKETAREYFQKALACEAQCQEKDFATARLEWLGPAP